MIFCHQQYCEVELIIYELLDEVVAKMMKVME
jgi:hypothetical protein